MTNDPVAGSRPEVARQGAGRARDLIRLRPITGDHDCPVDADYVNYRLEEAGATLLALPGTGWTTRLRSSSIEIVRTALEAYGWEAARIRPAVPSADKIDRMDEAMAWIPLIPDNRYVLRRVVGARSLVHPITDRHLYSWRRLGVVLGADHKAVQRWHAQGIGMIVAALHLAG
jgi:Domain of unknown function (DUF6362)